MRAWEKYYVWGKWPVLVASIGIFGLASGRWWTAIFLPVAAVLAYPYIRDARQINDQARRATEAESDSEANESRPAE